MIFKRMSHNRSVSFRLKKVNRDRILILKKKLNTDHKTIAICDSSERVKKILGMFILDMV